MTKTVLFVHGAFTSPASWDGFAARYRARGYRCVAPAWPYDDRPIPQLRREPDPRLAAVGIGEIVDHYAAAIRALDEPPIIVGHSFGGLFTQMLLDRGLGVAGVAIDPAPPKGVLPGVNAVRASLPVLMGWGAWRQVRMMSLDSFRWGWTHTLSDAEQRAAYEYVVPVPGRMFLQALLAPFTDVTKVDPRRRRAPLLIVAGQLDRTVEARMNRANFRMQQRAPATTEYRVFPGRTHWICAQPGWEEVADFALDWAQRQPETTRR